MAKRKKSTKKPAKGGSENVPVSKQTAGAVTGAVLGGVVGGPVGALAGGAVGAMVGDSSAKGNKPVKRAVDTVRDEITSGHAKAVLKKVGKRLKELRPTKKKKKAAGKKKSPVASKKKAKVAKTAKAKKAAKSARKKKAKKKA
jgi:hypothetical protein